MLDHRTEVDVDEECRFGPKRDRKCTDVAFCVLFVVFSLTTIGLTNKALRQADFSVIARPFDIDGNLV